MRYFWLAHRLPRVQRILLVESGSRELFEKLIPLLPIIFEGPVTIDLITCFGGVPKNLPPGRVYRTADYPTKHQRAQLYRELTRNDYQVTGLICSGERIMSKWKWALAYQVPAKVFLLNENGDYVWMDRQHLPTLWEFALVRAGLEGAGAVRTFGRLLLFPFSLVFLLAYAATQHLARWARTSNRRPSER